jgi:hypothetical protein
MMTFGECFAALRLAVPSGTLQLTVAMWRYAHMLDESDPVQWKCYLGDLKCDVVAATPESLLLAVRDRVARKESGTMTPDEVVL